MCPESRVPGQIRQPERSQPPSKGRSTPPGWISWACPCPAYTAPRLPAPPPPARPTAPGRCAQSACSAQRRRGDLCASRTPGPGSGSAGRAEKGYVGGRPAGVSLPPVPVQHLGLRPPTNVAERAGSGCPRGQCALWAPKSKAGLRASRVGKHRPL